MTEEAYRDGNAFSQLEPQVRDVCRIAQITAHYAHAVVKWPAGLIEDAANGEPDTGLPFSHMLFLVNKMEEMAQELVKIYYAAHEEMHLKVVAGKEART